MSAYIALHDRRLSGGVPTHRHLHTINTSKHTALATVFNQINWISRHAGPVNTLFILCHGYAGLNDRAGVCMDAGGMGLQLGRENVLHSNVARWTAIRKRVQNIVVYSCAASNTERGNEGSTADGRYLMGALAIHTSASVFAADRIQWYQTKNGNIDFGAWEGQLWQFPPNGNNPTQAVGAPVELADVLSGSAH
jgi:hypothetical protein